MKNPKPKFPCNLCKGDHFMRDCLGLTQVLEMWSSTSSTSVSHVDDTPSTGDVQVGKKNPTVKFPCMLCKGNNYSHLCPRMDEASSLLEKLQLPKGYRKLSSDPALVDGLVNLVPSPVSPVDQVVNLVSSLIEPRTQVVDPVSLSINPALHQKSDTKAVNPFPPVDPIFPLETETQVVDPVSPSVNPIPPLRNVKVADLVPSSVSPTLPLKSAKVVNSSPPLVDPIQSSVDPTLSLESKPDTAHVFLIDTDSVVPGGISPSPVKPPPSTEAIFFDWGVLTGPRLPSHIPFQITV
jgi:hypothetical protein